MSTSTNQSNICILGNSSSSPNITKIRHTYDKNTKISYLEFYYNINSYNGIYFQIFSPKTYSDEWTLLESLEKTEDDIDSFSVLSSADLTTKNRNVVTNSDIAYKEITPTLNSANKNYTFNSFNVMTKSNICFVSADITCNYCQPGGDYTAIATNLPYAHTPLIDSVGSEETPLLLYANPEGKFIIRNGIVGKKYRFTYSYPCK